MMFARKTIVAILAMGISTVEGAAAPDPAGPLLIPAWNFPDETSSASADVPPPVSLRGPLRVRIAAETAKLDALAREIYDFDPDTGPKLEVAAKAHRDYYDGPTAEKAEANRVANAAVGADASFFIRLLSVWIKMKANPEITADELKLLTDRRETLRSHFQKYIIRQITKLINTHTRANRALARAVAAQSNYIGTWTNGQNTIAMKLYLDAALADLHGLDKQIFTHFKQFLVIRDWPDMFEGSYLKVKTLYGLIKNHFSAPSGSATAVTIRPVRSRGQFDMAFIIEENKIRALARKVSDAWPLNAAIAAREAVFTPEDVLLLPALQKTFSGLMAELPRGAMAIVANLGDLYHRRAPAEKSPELLEDLKLAHDVIEVTYKRISEQSVSEKIAHIEALLRTEVGDRCPELNAAVEFASQASVATGSDIEKYKKELEEKEKAVPVLARELMQRILNFFEIVASTNMLTKFDKLKDTSDILETTIKLFQGSLEVIENEREAKTQFGPRYEILGQIGSGNNGQVFRCLDRQDNRMVAIKRVDDIFSSHFIKTKRVLREILILKQLYHPNIVKILNIGFIGETLEAATVNMFPSLYFI